MQKILNYLGHPIIDNAQHGSTYDTVRGADPELIAARSSQATFNLACLFDVTVATWNRLRVEDLDTELVKHRNMSDEKFRQFYRMLPVMVDLGDGMPAEKTETLALTLEPLDLLRVLRDHTHLWPCLEWAPMRAYLFSGMAGDAAVAAQSTFTQE